MTHRREQDEKAAERIEADLTASVEELERRVRRWSDVGSRLREWQGPLLAAGALVGGGLIAFGAWRFTTRRRRHVQESWAGVRRAARHPERLATRSKQKPIGAELGQRVLGAMAGIFAAQLARKMATRMVGT